MTPLGGTYPYRYCGGVPPPPGVKWPAFSHLGFLKYVLLFEIFLSYKCPRKLLVLNLTMHK